MTQYKSCPECSKNALLEDKICTNCGYPFLPSEIIIQEKKEPANQKQMIIILSGALALILSYIGYYLFTQISISPSPEQEQNTVQESIGSSTPILAEVRYINDLNVNIQESPSFASKTLFKASINDFFELTGQIHQDGKNKWIQLSSSQLGKGNLGWVLEKFISLQAIEQKIFFQDQCIIFSSKKICVGDEVEKINLVNSNFIGFMPDSEINKAKNKSEIFGVYYQNSGDYSGIYLLIKNNVILSINLESESDIVNSEEREYFKQNFYSKQNFQNIMSESILNDKEKKTLSIPFTGKDEYGLGLGSSVRELDMMLTKYNIDNKMAYFCHGKKSSYGHDENATWRLIENNTSRFNCSIDLMDRSKGNSMNNNGIHIIDNKISSIVLGKELSSLESLKIYNNVKKMEKEGDNIALVFTGGWFIHDPMKNSESNSNILDAPSGPATITGGENSSEEKAVREVLTRWQTVKRDAFLQGNTSELSSILSGAALTETQGGVEWWANPENGSYRDIQLHSLNIQSISFPQSNQAIAKVSISETKDNTVQGRKTSNYSATYELTKSSESWYISGIKAD